MPNWVKHSFTIAGPADVRQRFLEECFSKNEKGGLHLDFDRILPKPDGFDANLSSPAPLYVEAFDDPTRREEIAQFAWVVEAGPFESKRDLLVFLYRRMQWTPPATRQSDAEIMALIEAEAAAYKRNVELTGHLTWYEWNCAHWGTKWNACECSVILNEDHLELYFETAWSSPEPIFDRLRERYPELRWSGTIDEEGGFFWVVVKDNEAVDSGEGTRPGGPYDYGDEEEEAAADEQGQ